MVGRARHSGPPRLSRENSPGPWFELLFCGRGQGWGRGELCSTGSAQV